VGRTTDGGFSDFGIKLEKGKSKSKKKKVHGTFQGLGEGLNRRYRPAARNVATLLTETFILAIEHPIKTVSGPPVGHIQSMDMVLRDNPI
jgi:hypothetical protein